MTAETWTIIATGVVILIVIAASNRSMRTEMRTEMRAERAERIALGDGLRSELKELRVEVHDIHDRIDRVETTLTERMNRLEMDLRERLARVEGLFEGIRDSILGHKTPGAP